MEENSEIYYDKHSENNENINENNEKEDFSTKENNINTTNLTLRNEIERLNTKIGNYIASLKQKSKSNQINSQFQTEKMEEYTKLHKEISYYKEGIGKYRSQLEGIYNISKIDSLENELKMKKEILKKLKDEEAILKSLQVKNEKVIQDLEDKYENKNEIESLNKKISDVKEEIRLKKEIIKEQNEKKKEINSVMYGYDMRIAYLKERAYSHNQSHSHSQNHIGNNKIQSKNETNSYENINKSIENIEKETISFNKEKNHEIQEQIKLITKLKQENKALNSHIKDKERLNRIIIFNNKKEKPIPRTSQIKSNSIKLPDLNRELTKSTFENTKLTRIPKMKRMEVSKEKENNQKEKEKDKLASKEEMILRIERLKNEIEMVLKSES